MRPFISISHNRFAALVLACAACSTPPPTVVGGQVCSATYPDVCLTEGAALVRDQQTKQAGLKKLAVACDTDWPRRVAACVVGLIHRGDDSSEVLGEFDGFCEQGDRMACAWWGMRSLGAAFNQGPDPSVAALRTKLIERLEPVCRVKATQDELQTYGVNPQTLSCNSVAPFFEHGIGVPQDRDRAMQLWQMSCDAEDAHACAQVAYFTHNGWGTQADAQVARTLYAQACERHSAMACANLATIFMRGDGVARDFAKAAALLDRACQQNYLDSCSRLEVATTMKDTTDDPDAQATAFVATLDAQVQKLRSQLTDGQSFDVDEVKLQLKVMFDVDQLYRNAMASAPLDGPARDAARKVLSQRIGDVDRQHRDALKRIIKAVGWPLRSTYGRQANDNAWLIVQHADDDLAWQQEILARFESLLDQQEIARSHYAYLWDRVAVNSKKPQRYATQGHCVDGAWEPREMETPAEVDERRAAMGLQPLAEYRKMFEGRCD